MSAIKMSTEIKNELVSLLTPLKKEFSKIGFDFEIDEEQCEHNGYCLNFTGYYFDEYHKDSPTPFILLVVYVYDDFKQIQIPNIFLPASMHHHNIGLNMLNEIRKISNKYNYELFIVDMVNSFYHRMLRREAFPCTDCDDAVCIKTTTDLNSHF